jgi:hypothetical protein
MPKARAKEVNAAKELTPPGTAPAPRQRNAKGQSVSTPPRRPPAREKKATKDLDCARAAPAQRASKAKGKSVAAPARGQRGSRNKIGEAFIDALYKDWQKHGKTAIQTARDKYPTGYLRVVSSLLPKTFDIEDDALDKLTDEELDALIADLQKVLGAACKSGKAAKEAPR